MATTETSLLGLRTVTTSGFLERTPARSRRQSRHRIWRRWGAIAIAAALLPGCVNTKFKTDALVQSFVVGDEPRAVAIGRDVLAQGGKAGDAAAAMALAMTASLPSRVGLAGGGVCVLFDAVKKQARTIDFLPRAAGAGGVAMPGMLRGLYAVQATAGVQRWEQVVAPAEQLAQFSPGVSRALTDDLTRFGSRLSADSEMRRRFLPNGAVPAVGTPISQPELAGTLSVIRRNGVAALYNGPLAAPVAQALGIDPAALRAYQPRVAGTRSVPLGIVSMQFADTDLPESGAALVQAWNAVAELPPAQRAARAASVLGATGSGNGAAGAGLMVIDSDENGVACALTQGAPFGTGRSVPGTGILAAQSVESGGFGAPALLTNAIVGRTLFAGVGVAAGNDGPAAGPAALLSVALPAALEARTAEAIPVAGPGHVNFVACQVSPETGVRACQPGADPRGGGMTAVVETERLRE
ncbi:gamma-glutamyltransferase [Azospirillum doebereinerae]|uniref:gamma-glutamyltransferase n=1 Tax=Azospirillum doebereinerae TaxID=92933 RepID=UPI001EE55274|nr:gamma-glutamyltransferase [Azospirillum doebereinerae]MCG5239983.1 gamma-glutamyltransferase family protein [Azospirillum doebereinerae]